MQEKYRQQAMVMKALSDETRLKIFDMLSQGELCACKILEAFQITQPTLSYHMKILQDCGLVSGRRDGVWMKYSIHRESLRSLQGFLAAVDGRLENSSACTGKCSAKC